MTGSPEPDIHPKVVARSRELTAWIDEFRVRYALDFDPTEVGPLQRAEFDNGCRAVEAKYSEHVARRPNRVVPVVLSIQEAVVLLLRRFSGRLSDSAEAAAWQALAEGGPAVAAPLLTAAIAVQDVRLTTAETNLLGDISADPAGFSSDAEYSLDQDDVDVLYYFDPWSEASHEAAITRGGLDNAIAEAAAALPDVRLVGRAWRSRAQHHSPGTHTWVYVVVTDPRADVVGIRSRMAGLGGAGGFAYPVEVVEEERDLPFYQVALRARAKRIWPEDPHDRGITTRHWLH
ncbi:hypothetical protein [Yinghuangia sp. YIM S09857]|uniref:hypothetical protein n=1 Tax=Yinghuangia sp. YIM S09857 TaxID=3436929 RepID=UPI003F5318FA